MPRLVDAVLLPFIVGGALAVDQQFFVDCLHGSDANDGLTTGSPFLTLDRARLATHGAGNPVTVGVLPGDCPPRLAFQAAVNYSVPVLSLTGADSGTSAASVTYSAVAGPGSAHLVAGAELDPAGWKPFRGAVLQLDISALAPWGFGALSSGGLGVCTNDRAELFFDKQPMTLARYPNVPLGARPTAASFLYVGAVESPLVFALNASRVLSWKTEADPWLHGYWSEDWADNHVHAVAFAQPGGPGAKVRVTIDAATPPLYGVQPNARFYGENLLCELDTPGEYYVDTAKNILYFYPPAPLTSARAYLSMGKTAVSIAGAQHVRLDGFGVMFARGTGVTAAGVESVELSNLDVSNQGGSGVSLSGTNSVLRNVSGSGMGCKGLSVTGGDTSTLTAGNNSVIGCSLTRYARFCRTYEPGISWAGVGNRYIANTVADAPHTGMLGGGNDNLFEGNLFSDLGYESRDTGAFYSGRSWVARGNALVNNTFIRIRNTVGYNIGGGTVQVRPEPHECIFTRNLCPFVLQAIYLDDQLSQQYIINNTIIDSDTGLDLGGGRDVYVSGNHFRNVRLGVQFDNRGMTWQAAMCAHNASYTGLLVQQLYSVKYTSPPYAAFYPDIMTTLQNHPCVPVNVSIVGNSCCNCSQGFSDASPALAAKWFSLMADNSNVTTC